MTFHDNSSFWPKLRAVQKFFRQGIASFITVSFILNIAPVPIYAITPTEQEVLTNTPTQSLSEPEQTSSSIVVKEIVRQTTQDFLQENEIALTPVTSEKSNENVITSDNEPEITTSENDSFENAISKLTQAKDFAVAIVKQINQENLVHLAKQAYEYGIAVVKGVILLFTSHEENQLSVTAVFKSLLDTAVSFLAHFQVAHGQSPAQEQPSWMDIENALEVEHVASLQNEEVHVVTYGAQGVDPTVRNADYLLDKITAVHDPAQKSLEEIRQYVGVAEIQDKDSLIPYRSDPPTIFPGRPILSPFGSSSKFGQPDAFISVNQSSDSQFRLNFDVTNTSSTGNAFGGAVFNFAVSDTVKSQDLSGFSKFSFELRTDSACPAPDSQGCLKIEFKDTSGRVGAVRLSGITSSFQQGDIPKSLFLQSEPNLDFVHIKEIVFVVEHANVSPKQGFFEVKTGGLHFDASISPDATNPDITKVPQAGRKDDAGNTNLIRPDLTGFQSNNMDRRPPGTLAESRPEFQDWSKVDVNLTSETSAEITFNLFNVGGQKVGNDVVPTSFGGAFIAYDDPKTDDKDPLTTNDIETINLNTVFPNGIVLGLNHGGTGITEVFLEVTDITGKQDKVQLVGIDSTNRRWKVLASQFDEVDITKIKTFALTLAGRHVGQKLNVDWGNFSFVPGIVADATNPDITKVPQAERKDDAGNTNLIRPDLTGFQSNNTDRRAPGTTFESDTNLQDWSKVDVTMVSETFATIDFNLFNTGGNKVGDDTVPASFGGVFIDYDDPKTDDKDPLTTNDIERINLNALFPNGIVLGLDHGGTGLTEVFFEVTDITGKKDRVKLTGIEGTGKRWNVPVGRFDEVDVTKIKTLVLGAEGRHVGQKLNVDWGNFSFVPGVVADATNPDITKVPQAERKDDAGNTNLIRPDLTGFQSNNTDRRAPGTTFESDTNLQDWSKVDVTMVSETFATIDFNLFNTGGNKVGNDTVPASFGGVFIDYDDPKTTGGVIETIDLNALFPNGIVFGLDHGGTGLTEVFFEVTDITGKKDRVKLTGIEGTGKRWNVPVGRFDEVDVTKIKTLVLGAEGRHVGQKLNVDWGNFSFVPGVVADATNPAITKVPQAGRKDDAGNTNLIRPDLTGFQSNNTDRRAPGTTFESRPEFQDWSKVDVTMVSETFATIDFNLFNTGGNKVGNDTVPASFGGVFIDYDDPKTTGGVIETIDLNALFPNGIVFGLDHGGTGLTEVFFEVTDITGKKDRVKLTGIEGTGKRWNVPVGRFDEVDVTKIKTLVLGAEGRHVGQKLNVDWGNFSFVPGVVADATNPAITKVPQAGRKDDAGNTNLVRPDLTGFQSNNTDRRAPGTAFQSDTDLQDWSNVEVKQTSISGAEITFNLFNKGGKVNGKDVPDSFGGVFFDYDDPKTTGGVIETIDLNTAFPDGIVIELSNGGTGLTEVFLEATDITGKKDRARLVGIDGTNRRWKILTGQFDEVDRTKVRSLALVAVGRHVGEKLIVEWGDFSFTPSVDSDASNPAITKVPQATKKDVNGKDVLVRPDLTGFQSNNTDRRAPGTQPQSDPDLQDWSSVDVKQTSITSTEITFNLFNKGGKVNGKDVPDSFGGIVIDYDNPATNDNDKLTTTDIETIDLNTVFPDGIVIELNNGGTGINEVFLEVTDINGKKDQVRLINVTAAAKRWKIIPGLFDGVDRAKIRSLALVAVGRHVGEKLNVEWGDFNFVPVVTI